MEGKDLFCFLFQRCRSTDTYVALLVLSLCAARQNMMVKHMVETVVDRRQTDRGGLKISCAPQRHTSALPLNNTIRLWTHEWINPFMKVQRHCIPLSFKTNTINKQIPTVSSQIFNSCPSLRDISGSDYTMEKMSVFLFCKGFKTLVLSEEC